MRVAHDNPQVAGDKMKIFSRFGPCCDVEVVLRHFLDYDNFRKVAFELI